jgi:chemotaxis protein CheX
MANVSAEHINPFLMASSTILKEMCFVEASIGKPFIKSPAFFEDTLLILIGFTGAMKGQVIIAFEQSVACDIASKMMMMPVATLDEMAMSAIGELGNMIMGNTATIFSTKGIGIDITPPTIGNGTMVFSTNYAANICVPLTYDGNKTIEVNIAIKGE